MAEDPYYKKCARRDEGDCAGRITWEHAFYWKGKRLNEKWCIIPICAYHHAVDEFSENGKLNKEKHLWIALTRADDETLKKYSKATDYIALRNRLNEKYHTHR